MFMFYVSKVKLLSILFELSVCVSLSDTKPLTYRVSDMPVDLNLYVQAICSYSLIMSFLVSPNLCGTG